MFSELLRFITRFPPPHHGHGFVLRVTVVKNTPRNPRVDWLILVCWLLIAVKHVAIIWAVNHYPIPFHQLWINFPTWLLGVLATGIYYGRMHRK